MDGWRGGVIRLGSEPRLRILTCNPRCAMTPLAPNTKWRDVDTLRDIPGRCLLG